jgi:putative glutamine amidotransferase
MKKSAKIGITMRLESATRRFYLGRDYSEALAHFGAVPLHISLIPEEKYIQNLLKNLDGILLPGSDSDVNPLIFNEEPHPSLKNVVPEKDETDLLVLKFAEKYKIPVLTICFGMQVLNVSRGGNLIQDIETQVENCVKHEQGIPLERNSHSIEFNGDGILSRLITSKNSKNNFVNSHHHQAVKNVGKNLKATAWAKDGIVECIEDRRDDRFVLGVQWHPELSWKTDDLSKNIFKEFVNATEKFAKNKGENSCDNAS